VAVFGILKWGGKVVDNTHKATLMPVIEGKIAPDSIVYTDSYSNYNALDVSRFRHKRINHSVEFGHGRNHINGIENFWNQAKRVLRKYNGIPKENFPLFLKECEFRFNYGTHKQQLKTLKEWAGIQSYLRQLLVKSQTICLSLVLRAFPFSASGRGFKRIC
jgi:transposase